MKTTTYWTLLSVLAVVNLGCGSSDGPDAKGPPRVCTTFYPMTYFCERIGGDHVRVTCPLPPDEDPIFWTPSAEAIQQYQQADLIAINGAGFEKWVAKASLPPSKVVDTARPLEKEFLKFALAVTHSHGPGGGHSHEGIDGHTWLDPAHAKVQAEEICKALERLLPERADALRANFAKLATDLDALDRSLAELSEELADQPILASHSAYNYLAKRYEWNVTNLDLDPEAMPDEATLNGIADKLESQPAKIILWESEPTAEIAARFQERFGLTSIVFSPCETLDEETKSAENDYISLMNDNIARLRDTLVTMRKRPPDAS